MVAATRAKNRSDNGMLGHEVLVRARTEEMEWAARCASRVRSFIPEPEYSGRHRAPEAQAQSA